MSTHYQFFLNIGRAAGTRNKSELTWKFVAIFYCYGIDGILNIG